VRELRLSKRDASSLATLPRAQRSRPSISHALTSVATFVRTWRFVPGKLTAVPALPPLISHALASVATFVRTWRFVPAGVTAGLRGSVP
jgi:hypothetical protein